MKFYYSIFFTFLFQFLNAQVPGYMGKHVVVGYSLNFFPALMGPTALKANEQANLNEDEIIPNPGKPYGINTTNVLNFDFIHKNRKAICIAIQYARSGVSQFLDIGNITYAGDLKVPAKLNSFGFSLSLKLFKRSNFAPYGPYVKWEAMYLVNSINYSTNYYMVDRHNNNTIIGKIPESTKKQHFKFLELVFHGGNNEYIKINLYLTEA